MGRGRVLSFCFSFLFFLFQVRISVNDERVPFYMKVGETGEAFFVFETEADVPESLQTSPLSGPVSDDGQDGDDNVSHFLSARKRRGEINPRECGRRSKGFERFFAFFFFSIF